MPTIKFYPAEKRGVANHGWLETFHSFSFASWYDPEKIRFGMLRVLNDDFIAGGMGFGMHPHDNMEIITIVTDGVLQHKDSMGNTGLIHAGEVQVMSAGTGILHSEFNHLPDKPLHLFQIWIFPDKKMVEPRYDQLSYSVEDRKNKLQLLVSPIGNEENTIKIHQQAWIYRSALDKGMSLQLNLKNKNHGFYIFVVEGKIQADENILKKRDAIGISGQELLSVTALENSDILVFEIPM